METDDVLGDKKNTDARMPVKVIEIVKKIKVYSSQSIPIPATTTVALPKLRVWFVSGLKPQQNKHVGILMVCGRNLSENMKIKVEWKGKKWEAKLSPPFIDEGDGLRAFLCKDVVIDVPAPPVTNQVKILDTDQVTVTVTDSNTDVDLAQGTTTDTSNIP